MSEIEIRPLTSMQECRIVEEIQQAVWTKDAAELAPAHMLHALQHNGAALLGAFDGPQMVAFSLGVLATITDKNRIDQIAAARLKMYSVMTGVLPGYQNLNLGYRLKLAQRDFALRVGIRLITWTYDPLESRNGRFNIAKLGAVCNQYLRNFHGDLGGINAGLETDRFDVEWWVTSHRVKGRVDKPKRPLPLNVLLDSGAVLVNEATFNSQKLPVPPPNFVSRPSNLMLVEIPADFQTIKEQNFELALRWRQHTRMLFEQLFQDGFIVTDFISELDALNQRRSFYLLTYREA